jgi:hypothetical protein
VDDAVGEEWLNFCVKPVILLSKYLKVKARRSISVLRELQKSGGDAMKSILLLPIAMVAIALHGQTSAVAPILGARVNAELTKRIDAKKAKVGDTVEAKTTSAVKLPDGTELPKGTKLTGKVTDVRAKSNSDKTSHLAFNLDEALMKARVPLKVSGDGGYGPLMRRRIPPV